jgi:very-short-patch-repair endonuclease
MESSASKVEQMLQRWQGKLVDMSLRNRLLNLPESAALRPLAPDVVLLFERLVAKGVSMRCRFDAAKEGDVQFAAGGEKALAAMRRKARAAKQDQGFNALHMAFGLLEWVPPETSRPVLAPLLLAPVEIERRGQLTDHFLRASGGEPVLNPALALKLQADLGLELPPLPPAERLDVESFFRQVEMAISSRPGWKVHRVARLGLFTFSKLVMYMDLKANVALAARHPMIRALAGDPGALDAAAVGPKAEDLDRVLDARTSFSVLDADSSQQEAVEAVRGGGSVVLQGPPGTGKSQTITNVIAECLAMGKSVLFVSEKMAALQVVKARLESAGLGDFCLELHDNALPRAEVVARMAAGLDALPEEGREDLSAQEEVNALKLRLDSYASALHRPRGGLQISAYQAMGELAYLAGTPQLVFRLEGATKADAQRMMAMLTCMDRLEGMRAVMAVRRSHPWRDCDLKDLTFAQQADVLADLQGLALAADEAGSSARSLAEACRLPEPTSVSGARYRLILVQQAMSSPPPLPGWLSADAVPGILQWAEKEKGVVDHLRATEASLLSEYAPSIFSLDGRALKDRFEKDHAGSLRAISGTFRQDMRSISSCLRGPRDLGYEDGLKAARDLAAYQSDIQWLNAHAAQDASLFGQYFSGPATDWARLLSALRAAQATLEAVGDLDDASRQFLAEGRASKAEVRQAFAPSAKAMTSLDKALERMGRYMRDGRLDVSGKDPSAASCADLAAWGRELERNADRLREWVDLMGAEDECRRLGLGDLLRAAYAELPPPGGLRPAFRQRFMQIFLDDVLADEALLRDFNAQEQASIVDRFRKADNAMIERARLRLRRQLRGRLLQERPAAAPVKVQEALLRKEMGKKGRWKPTRELLAETPDLLAVLKPCVLMSPLSVSQFLEPTVSFDVLVFDEASQIAPEDALCAIMRSRQLVVVGDSMQLPPTRFFEASSDEEYSPTAEDLESILDECASIGLPRRMLLWHYRSRHESLIAFSNLHFYGGRLSTFPAARLARPGLGVEFVQVEGGVYDRGGRRDNIAEARKVAELALAHASASPKLSLGVVAFSEPQQDAIIDAVEDARRGRKDLEAFFDENKAEAFFVKNLENVQGDERDVMIFSVGYGKDKDGRMVQGFGPLNLEGGERRLNVAITRARSNVKLVSSITAGDVAVDPSSPKGAAALKDYLDYAQRGGATAKASSVAPTEKDLLVESVARALEADGMKVVTGVGCSAYKVDLAVVDEASGRYLLGLECEGAAYMTGRTSRDRERLRQQVLSNLGWDVIRIWTRDWVQARGREMERVRAAVARGRDKASR